MVLLEHNKTKQGGTKKMKRLLELKSFNSILEGSLLLILSRVLATINSVKWLRTSELVIIEKGCFYLGLIILVTAIINSSIETIRLIIEVKKNLKELLKK